MFQVVDFVSSLLEKLLLILSLLVLGPETENFLLFKDAGLVCSLKFIQEDSTKNMQGTTTALLYVKCTKLVVLSKGIDMKIKVGKYVYLQ